MRRKAFWAVLPLACAVFVLMAAGCGPRQAAPLGVDGEAWRFRFEGVAALTLDVTVYRDEVQDGAFLLDGGGTFAFEAPKSRGTGRLKVKGRVVDGLLQARLDGDATGSEGRSYWIRGEMSGVLSDARGSGEWKYQVSSGNDYGGRWTAERLP